MGKQPALQRLHRWIVGGRVNLWRKSFESTALGKNCPFDASIGCYRSCAAIPKTQSGPSDHVRESGKFKTTVLIFPKVKKPKAFLLLAFLFLRFGYTLNVEFKKETLKNGVRLLTLPMSHLDSVAVIIGVSAGSRFEEPRTQGVAHFTEHMLFKGTKRRPNNRVIATELESKGASFNAFTGPDITAYYVRSAAKNLPWSLEILTDLVFNSKFDPKEIEKEKGVIIEELRMNHDNPQDWVEHLSLGMVFPNHPLGRLITGTEETIKGMKQSDFLSYLDGWYRSKNMVAIIAGNLSQKGALANAREVLAVLPQPF